MTAAEKFLFDTTFDQPDKGGTAKPLPTHTDEQVEQVREQAFQAGHEAALVEARKLEERRIKELFDTVATRIDMLGATRVADTTEIARQATQVAVAICRKVLPEMARRNALSEVENMIRDCIAAMPEEPRIVVRVADEMVDALQSRITEFAGGFDGKLVLLGDDQMQLTDCAVVWADGGTERNLDRLWQDIDNAVDRLLANSAPVETHRADSDPDAAAAPGDTDFSIEDGRADVDDTREDSASTPVAAAAV